jgi:hypothetical protein
VTWRIDCEAGDCTAEESSDANFEYMAKHWFRHLGWRIVCRPLGGLVTFCPNHTYLGEAFLHTRTPGDKHA